MFKQIAGTTFTRIITTALGFLTVILATRHLGAHEFGNISLFVLTISLLQLLSGIAGGPALVYLTPRMSEGRLFTGALLWTISLHILAYFVLSALGLWNGQILYHLIVLSMIFFANSFAYTTLLGRRKIARFNLIQLMQAVLLAGTLAMLITFTENRSMQIYIVSLYVSWTLSSITGWLFILPGFKWPARVRIKSDLRKMIRYGGYLQMANGLQLLNYRLSYFLINHFLGRSLLGVYTAGVQLSEGLWIFSKSFAVVHYSNVSNSNNREIAIKSSIQLIKLVFLITLAGLVILLLIPAHLYAALLGDDFLRVKDIIVWLSPGILALGISQILSHYFSGTGKQQLNATSSAIGLIITLAGGLILIPVLGIAGAGITASVAYTLATLYQLVVFFKISRCNPSDFLISLDDIRQMIVLTKNAVALKSGSAGKS